MAANILVRHLELFCIFYFPCTFVSHLAFVKFDFVRHVMPLIGGVMGSWYRWVYIVVRINFFVA